MYVLTTAPRPPPQHPDVSNTRQRLLCLLTLVKPRLVDSNQGEGFIKRSAKKNKFLKKPASARLCTAHSFVMMNGMLAADQMACCLCPFVSNALTWYSSPPPFNLFGPEPTLNAQIASFHRDSSVSRAVLLH